MARDGLATLAIRSGQTDEEVFVGSSSSDGGTIPSSSASIRKLHHFISNSSCRFDKDEVLQSSSSLER